MAWVKESEQDPNENKTKCSPRPQTTIKRKKSRPQVQHMLEPVSKILGRGYGKGAPGVGHNCWILFHTWHMYIWILLDHLMTTQPISVSVSVGEAAA